MRLWQLNYFIHILAVYAVKKNFFYVSCTLKLLILFDNY